jgi:hypothetical protein
MERVVADLMEKGEEREAWRTLMEWNEWLGETGQQHREPDRVEADVRSQQASVGYHVVELPADADPAIPDIEESAGSEDVEEFAASPPDGSE